MTKIAELTDLEAEKRLTELLGGHLHENGVRYCGSCGPSSLPEYEECCESCGELMGFQCKHCNGYLTESQEWDHIPYATSYDCIIPVIQGMDAMDTTRFLNIIGYSYYLLTNKNPRQLLNVVIEVLESE